MYEMQKTRENGCVSTGLQPTVSGNFSCRYSEELKLLKTLDFSQRLIRLWRKSRVEKVL
jgi:hypothetical protein